MTRNHFCTAAIFVLIAVLYCPLTAFSSDFLTIDWTITASEPVSGQIETNILKADIIAAMEDPEKEGEELFEWNSMEYPELYQHPEEEGGWWVAKSGAGHGPNVAYLESLSIGIEVDPSIDFGFSARAHDGPTHFSFSSSLLLLTPAYDENSEGWAWSNPEPGLFDSIISGDFTDGKMYRAEYNGGTVFADLSPTPIDNPPGGTTDWVPSTVIGEQITSMQTHWGFTLSAGGSASGTSFFEITGDVIPEPASILLLGLGGLALIRKRRP